MAPGGFGSVAPRFLDPILAIVEMVDRRVRRIRPARDGAMLGVEIRRHRGALVALTDGTQVRPGDRLWMIHFDNARLRQLASGGWERGAYEAAAADLRAIARRLTATPSSELPVALGGITILAPLTRRSGFEVHPRAQGWWARVEDWYLRSLLVRWAPEGRRRLQRGRRARRAAHAWMSAAELLRRYGPPPE